MLAELLILGAIIGSNNFATALALGSLGQEARRSRIVLVFGLFEFFVPFLGLWLGQRISEIAAGSLDFLGPVLLVMLGAWTIYTALLVKREAEQLASRITSWRGLIMLSAGLSIDNLIVGFSLGLGEVKPLVLAATIAGFSMTFAFLGLRLGAFARDIHRRSATAVTGLLLIGLAAALASGVL